ncbi:hypothetical protein LEP1GSC199_0989 [Leptospira vanthielii serovar Holland str. Waz Holland = ATCC 700522]|uniref:Uncharacterized protein n=1 Tax=Leptospira vanthielii serovar Holland str. Waz Holland = ATCC 700522 TaxID=1218591 RepID=N1W4A8_9LEPT|nr:hypothetical protein LEP1GSC199_0989 [Leptospira vanthielii serovar Holland str. Waz Holland = ATCC 700522]
MKRLLIDGRNYNETFQVVSFSFYHSLSVCFLSMYFVSEKC